MVWLAFFLFFYPSTPIVQEKQERERKPVLIRADPNEAGEDKAEAEAGVVLPDPVQARKHVEVGDFYFRRENYKAAADRYREAIRYNPKWAEAYEKLTRSLEKQTLLAEAAEVCRQFVQDNPSSKEAARFQEWEKRLRAHP